MKQKLTFLAGVLTVALVLTFLGVIGSDLWWLHKVRLKSIADAAILQAKQELIKQQREQMQQQGPQVPK